MSLHSPPRRRPVSVRRMLSGVALAAMAGLALASSRVDSNLPLSETPFASPGALIAWVGTGTAYAHIDGQWQRAPASDYEFSVTQRRYATHWESIKTQHRRHPRYDGSAGPRDQAHYFRIDYAPAATPGAFIDIRLASSLGTGTGQIDAGFRTGTLEFAAAGVSRFAPYNHYRITQQYRYQEGQLVETVELSKRAKGIDTAFMRFEERARLLAPQAMDGAPALAGEAGG